MTATDAAPDVLPAAMLDWWFAPWSYASASPATTGGLVAQRDDYRGWCTRHAVIPDLPSHYDTNWHIAAMSAGVELLRSASLFGGLFGARERDRASLSSLSHEARHWCLKVSLGQPLQPLVQTSAAALLPVAQQRGLTELAARLERRFPGMWSRLALMLPAQAGQAITGSIRQGAPTAAMAETDSANLRALRCWRLCVEQARTMPAA